MSGLIDTMRSMRFFAQQKTINASPADGAAATVENDGFDPSHPPSPLAPAFTEIVSRAAALGQWPPGSFDVAATVESLCNRFTWRIDLSNLSESERLCLDALDKSGWKALSKAVAKNAGSGYEYLECDASLLPTILRRLEKTRLVPHVAVWAPPGGGLLDLGKLKGDIEILGTPEKPLQVCASRDARVSAQEPKCQAIVQSQLRTRNRWGTLEAPRALPTDAAPGARADAPAPREMPCVGDAQLHARVTALAMTRAQPRDPTDAVSASAAINALLLCGRFDDSERFGFDLTALDPRYAKWVEKLPPAGWDAIRRSAGKCSQDIEWLDVPKALDIHKIEANVRALRPFLKFARRWCADDAKLIKALEWEFQVLAAGPDFPNETFQPEAVARAVAFCGTIDDEGRFGFDFKSLSPLYARLVDKLPPLAWAQLQKSAARIGQSVERLDLPEQVDIDTPKAAAFAQLPLKMLSFRMTKNRIFVGLGPLKSLKVVEIYPQPTKRFEVSVPKDASVHLANGAPMEQIAQTRSKINYANDEGALISSRGFRDLPT
jgi:hypothetical protein